MSSESDSDDSLLGLGAMTRVLEAEEEDEALEAEEAEFKSSGGSSIYGIVTDDGVKALLERASSAMELKGKVFYDVGSGNGEAILSAAEQFPALSAVVGIELSKYRHSKASEARDELSASLRSKIELRCQDALLADISGADIVLLNNLVFEPRFNQAFGMLCDTQLRAGAVLFSVKPVPTKRGKVDKSLCGDVDCSWGVPTMRGYVMNGDRMSKCPMSKDVKNGGDKGGDNGDDKGGNEDGAVAVTEGAKGQKDPTSSSKLSDRDTFQTEGSAPSAASVSS